MACIYKITNDINNKIYIGYTDRTIKERWKEHKADSFKKGDKKRPLYSAIQKYGIEHFHIELIEETDNPKEREKFWINYYNSYKNGYNATQGGDGILLYNYDLIVDKYKELQNLEKVAKQLKISNDTVRSALNSRNINIISSGEVTKKLIQKSVMQYDLQDNYIQTFESLYDAAKSVIKPFEDFKGAASHISDVCKGRRKTAYKYKWKFTKI